MALKKTTDTEETAEKKTAVKKTAAKKSAAAEKTAAKKSAAAEKKTAAAKKGILTKKSADEKEPAGKKTTKRASSKKNEPKISLVIEYAGRQLNTDDVIASVREAYMKDNPDTAIETAEIYIQPEKNVAYYVVNGESEKNGRVKI